MSQKLKTDCHIGENMKKLCNQRGPSQEKLCTELQRRSCDIGRTVYTKVRVGGAERAYQCVGTVAGDLRVRME